MKYFGVTGSALGISLLLCSCGEKTSVLVTNEDTKPAEADAGASVPDDQICRVELHDPGAAGILDASVQFEVLAKGFEIAEGPVWVPSMKTLLFSDVKGNTIHQWSQEKGLSVFLSPGGHTGAVPFFEGGVLGSNGLALDPAGDLIICQHGDRRLAKLSFDNINQEGLSTLVATYEGKRFNSPNDLTVVANGDIYFTDPPYGHCDIANSVPGRRWYSSTRSGRFPTAGSTGMKPPRAKSSW